MTEQTKAEAGAKLARLWIDCEFNEFRGDLISLALVDEAGRAFYEVLPCANPGTWVAEHVMPILGREPVDKATFQTRLAHYLAAYPAIHVIADWPEDVAHFCNALITGPGYRLDTPPLTMEVVRIDAPSAIPHNALADAIGIRDAMLAAESHARALTGASEKEQQA